MFKDDDKSVWMIYHLSRNYQTYFNFIINYLPSLLKMFK